MNTAPDNETDVLRRLERLARGAASDINHLQKEPEFLRFVELCQSKYPQIKSGSSVRFSLASALQQLGLACLVGGKNSELASSALEIAVGLDKAIRSTAFDRVHLCPLDLATHLPPLSFGSNRVHRFSAGELEDLFDILHLRRANRKWSVDSERLSQFSWLVVSEHVQHDDVGPDGRTLPSLFVNLDQDFGRIEPHKSGFPPAVEAALFAMLMIPWEQIAEYQDMEWRGFRIPWVYTVDADVFSRRVPPPSPESLNWEPAFHFDAYGDEHEYERPVVYPLNDGSDDALSWLDNKAWDHIRSARQSELFNRPVAHFFVRGFQSEGVDEFLAHISTIEAAVGSPTDHDMKARSRINGGNPGATRRVALRVAGLLFDAAAGAAYARLFGIRSDFLHGKPMADISGKDRRSARELARKVVCALVATAAAEPMIARDQFLDGLLDTGSDLTAKSNSDIASS